MGRQEPGPPLPSEVPSLVYEEMQKELQGQLPIAQEPWAREGFAGVGGRYLPDPMRTAESCDGGIHLASLGPSLPQLPRKVLGTTDGFRGPIPLTEQDLEASRGWSSADTSVEPAHCGSSTFLP